MAKQPVDNYRLGEYPVEVETQENGEQRQVVSISQLKDGDTILGKVIVVDGDGEEIEVDDDGILEVNSSSTDELLTSILLELQMVRTAMSRIIGEDLEPNDIEDVIL